MVSPELREESLDLTDFLEKTDMSRKLLLKEPTAINNFADRLAKSHKVNSFDTEDEKECGTIAYNFSELEKYFCEFLDVHLPKLAANNLTPKEIEDILFDIGDEFRHIVYHIKDPKYFRDYISDMQ